MRIANGSCFLFYNVVKLKNCSPIGSPNYFANLDWFMKFKNWDQHLCHLPFMCSSNKYSALMCSSNKYSEGLLCAKRWSTDMKKTALCAHREKGTNESLVTKKLPSARFPGSLSAGINLSLNKLKLSCLENVQIFACWCGKRNEGKRKLFCSGNF